jgi:transcriptional antiterminator NusG
MSTYAMIDQRSRSKREHKADHKSRHWYVLHTHSRCEQLVYKQLVAKGFQLFLPSVEMWSRRAGLQRVIRVPLFAGYLFLNHIMDKYSYIEVKKARGLVNILNDGAGQLAVVPDSEINSIRSVILSRLPVLAHPYIREGQKVRITDGVLAGVEGILLRTNVDKGLLILLVNLLQRGLAVEVDCTAVEAV